MPTSQTPEALAEEIAQLLETCQDTWHDYKDALRMDAAGGEWAKAANAHTRAETAFNDAINRLRDMAASGAKDAERYQWLRDSRRIPRDDDPERHAVIVAPGGEDVLWGTSLDATCDAAIAATKRGGA